MREQRIAWFRLRSRSPSCLRASRESDGSVVAWGYNGYGQTTVPGGLTVVHAIAAGGYHTVALAGSSVGFGDQATATTSDARTFTIKNTGVGPLGITSVGVAGGNASDFTVNTAGMLTSVPATTGATAFTVTFTHSAAGARWTLLRVLSSDSDEGAFDIVLTGTGTDTVPPVLSLPANITTEATVPAGATVSYTASASDTGGSWVATSSFLPASGSVFPFGTTTVQASATDQAGNTTTGSFTVTVQDTTAPTISGISSPLARDLHRQDDGDRDDGDPIGGC